MRPSAVTLQTLRAFVDELGPLLWVAVATAVVPTAGLLVLLAHLPDLALAWPAGAAGTALAGAAIAVATGSVLLPPSVGAFAAGYLLGWPAGSTIAVLGIGCGAVIGQRLVWPLLGARVYAFMRARARVHGVQAFVAGSALQQSLRVATMRCSAKFPFSVISLLLSAASVSACAVWFGSLLGAVPLAYLAGGVGASWRRWCDQAVPPSWLQLASLGLAAGVGLATTVVARRAMRQAPTV